MLIHTKLHHRCGVNVKTTRKQIEMSRDEHKSLWFTAKEWEEFTKAVKAGEFDLEYINRFDLLKKEK